MQNTLDVFNNAIIIQNHLPPVAINMPSEKIDFSSLKKSKMPITVPSTMRTAATSIKILVVKTPTGKMFGFHPIKIEQYFDRQLAKIKF